MKRGPALLTMLLVGLTALPATARDHAPGAGAAIVPVFTAQHSAMRPGEEVTLVACVANGNPHVRHGIRQGDDFRFDFMEGVLRSCGDLSVSPPALDMAPSDWACATDGQALLLSYRGPDAAWPTGTAICATVQFTAPPRPSTIVPSVLPVQVGSYAPPVPPLVQLAIASSVGSVGPPGPEGPQGAPGPRGPEGPMGESAVGARHEWISTDSTGPLGPPDDVIPGLDQVVSVRGGSSLLIMASASFHLQCRPSSTSFRSTALVVELDGVAVSERWVLFGGFSDAGTGRVAAEHLALDLDEGLYRIRVRVPSRPSGSEGSGGAPMCAGHASDPVHFARLIAVELRR